MPSNSARFSRASASRSRTHGIPLRVIRSSATHAPYSLRARTRAVIAPTPSLPRTTSSIGIAPLRRRSTSGSWLFGTYRIASFVCPPLSSVFILYHNSDRLSSPLVIAVFGLLLLVARVVSVGVIHALADYFGSVAVVAPDFGAHRASHIASASVYSALRSISTPVSGYL